MSRPKRGRAKLLGELNDAVRAMGIQTVMFHQGVAEEMGIGATDSRALSILEQAGPLSAGRLAELTGLTTGAVTGMIDRLERAGWVRRSSDPADRRKVIIEPIRDPERDAAVGALFESLRRSFARLAADYDDEELVLILEFIRKGTEMMRAETRNLRGGS